MSTIKDVPAEVLRKILSYLSPKDELSVAEASPDFERASDLQVEYNTNMRIQEGKRKLLIVIGETDCRNALSSALLFYEEIHLILSRSIVEDGNCDSTYNLRRWFEEVTGDGVAPFTTIEVVGRIKFCGCKFAFLTRCVFSTA